MKLLLCLPIAGVCLAADLSLTIAGLSVMPQPWKKAANLDTLDTYARRAAREGAQLVLTPEGFLEGYVGNDKRTPSLTREQYVAIGEPMDGPYLKKVRALAQELKIYLGIGFAERSAEKMFNSFVVFAPDGSVALHYSKVHNADDEPFNTTGTAFPVASTAFGRWGALICYDRRLPETSRILAVRGAQLILVPSWGSYNEMNDALMRTRAFENSVWVAFVHPQRALIIDPSGRIVAKDDGTGDQIVRATIYPEKGDGQGPIQSRKPELYRDILGSLPRK